ncbi:MAG: protease modulator HflC [Spirochaetaceae bacterium]|nr:MAG: protease modulator HflC [Spirochaetaceae bacterium]
MKPKKLVSALVVLAVVVIVFFMLGPLYIVNEGEQAVVIRFGEIVGVTTEAGLHFKTPVLDNVVRYPQRILAWDGEAQRIPTAEQQFIWVDTTARWRIIDPARFYASVTTVQSAYGRLDELIDSTVRNVITANRLSEAVRNSNVINEIVRDPAGALTDAELEDADGTEELQRLLEVDVRQPSISRGRQTLADQMLRESRPSMGQFGIELIDVVVRQIRYSEDLTESVYDRMVSERNREAQALRSDGEGQRLRILGQLENERARIISGAEEQADRVRGTADAEAARIYSTAYLQDPNFFAFYRSVQSYRETMPRFRKTLTTDMDYFRFLYSETGN